MLAALVVIPASLSSFASDQENSQSDDVLNQIVPNKASDRNAMGDSHMDTRVCPPAAPGEATCIAIERDYFKRGVKIEQNATSATPNAATPKLNLVGFNSSQLRSAYGILTTEQGSSTTVIAIVDAYGYPSALTDLNTYRNNYGIVGVNSANMSACPTTLGKPTFPTANVGCFAQISGVTGLTTSLPKSNTGWNQEGALDIEMATAICPKCSILFVAANSASFADLNKAVGQANTYTNVVAISNSYGGADFAETGLAPDNYQLAAARGVAVTASSGDSGYGAQSPASFTNVIGVGGTSLTLNANGTRTSEIIWTSAGSGCSTQNPIPTQQTTLGTTGCVKKAVSDISAVANPNTGVGVIYGGKVYQFGGTSVSSPIIASIFAVADYKPTQGTYAGASLYNKANATTNIYDVVGGAKNGNCPTATAKWCTTGTGWDGPTGLGAPLNTGAFH